LGFSLAATPRPQMRVASVGAFVDVILLPPHAIVAVQLIFTQTNAILIQFFKEHDAV